MNNLVMMCIDNFVLSHSICVLNCFVCFAKRTLAKKRFTFSIILLYFFPTRGKRINYLTKSLKDTIERLQQEVMWGKMIQRWAGLDPPYGSLINLSSHKAFLHQLQWLAVSVLDHRCQREIRSSPKQSFPSRLPDRKQGHLCNIQKLCQVRLS